MVVELSEKQVKNGWQVVKFGEIAKNISKRVDPAETDLKVYVGLEHLDPHSLRITRRGEPADVKGQKLRVRPGQIIFGKRRAYQKKVAVADFDGICSAHAMVLEEVVGKIIPGLLPFFMQSDMFMDRAVAISEGSLSPTIKWKTLAIQEFPLPSVERQEEIFEVLKKTSEVLFKCGGAITAAALAESALIAHLISNKNHNVSNTKVQTAVGYVSDDMPVYTISELIKSGDIVEIQDGNHGNAHPKAKDYVDRPGIPFVMARDIIDDQIDTANCKFLARKHADSLRIGFSKPGDILLTHKGTVGLVAETPETFDYVMLTPQVTYYRIAKGGILNKEYLKILFKSKGFQRTIILQSSQSTRAYLSLTQQKKLKIPVPNISTQESIVNSYLTLHDNKKRLSKHQLRLSSLYQSLNCELLNIGGTQ